MELRSSLPAYPASGFEKTLRRTGAAGRVDSDNLMYPDLTKQLIGGMHFGGIIMKIGKDVFTRK